MPIMLALAAVITAASPVPARPVRLLVSGCVTTACTSVPPRSRYRLNPQGDLPLDMKQTALATDGSECSVVGGRVCTQKPSPIIEAAFGN